MATTHSPESRTQAVAPILVSLKHRPTGESDRRLIEGTNASRDVLFECLLSAVPQERLDELVQNKGIRLVTPKFPLLRISDPDIIQYLRTFHLGIVESISEVEDEGVR